MELNTKIAKDLLKIKAVFFRPEEPFTWASGIKSPVYCDNRLTLSDPEVRTDVEEGLAELIKNHYPEVEVLMGTSTAGIAHAAITAHLMGLPMGYVRSGHKDHGRQNQIEGRLEKGQKSRSSTYSVRRAPRCWVSCPSSPTACRRVLTVWLPLTSRISR